MPTYTVKIIRTEEFEIDVKASSEGGAHNVALSKLSDDPDDGGQWSTSRCDEVEDIVEH